MLQDFDLDTADAFDDDDDDESSGFLPSYNVFICCNNMVSLERKKLRTLIFM